MFGENLELFDLSRFSEPDSPDDLDPRITPVSVRTKNTKSRKSSQKNATKKEGVS